MSLSSFSFSFEVPNSIRPAATALQANFEKLGTGQTGSLHILEPKIAAVALPLGQEAPSGVLEKPHETKIHVEILVAVKQGQPGIVGYKINLNPAEALG